MPHEGNPPPVSEERMVQDVKHIEEFPQLDFKDKNEKYVRPMPGFGDFEDVPDIEVSLNKIERQDSKARPSTTLKRAPTNAKEIEELNWKLFYCLENYIN